MNLRRPKLTSAVLAHLRLLALGFPLRPRRNVLRRVVVQVVDLVASRFPWDFLNKSGLPVSATFQKSFAQQAFFAIPFGSKFYISRVP